MPGARANVMCASVVARARFRISLKRKFVLAKISRLDLRPRPLLSVTRDAMRAPTLARYLERFPPRECAACGEPFPPSRSDAKTCSEKCRVALHRGKRTLTLEDGNRVTVLAPRADGLKRIRVNGGEVRIVVSGKVVQDGSPTDNLMGGKIPILIMRRTDAELDYERERLSSGGIMLTPTQSRAYEKADRTSLKAVRRALYGESGMRSGSGRHKWAHAQYAFVDSDAMQALFGEQLDDTARDTTLRSAQPRTA
jgi:hypothetical protein